MIRCLILDAGGVLVRPLHKYWDTPAAYPQYLGAYADRVDGAEWHAAITKHRPIIREDVFIPDVETEHLRRTEFLRAVLDELGWHIPDADFDALCHDFSYNTERYIWYEDVDFYLKKWSRWLRIGILSDAMPSVKRVFAERESLSVLSGTVISTDIGCCKPDPRMYEAILRKLNAEPDECLFVDDRENNLRGAMDRGIRAVQMDRGGVELWNGDVVHDFAELDAYLEARA